MTNPLFGKSHPIQELERDFQERVCHYARIKRWSVYAIPDSRRASIAGYPDLTLWRGERLIWAELKREKGRLSDAQMVVLEQLGNIPCAEVYVWKPSKWDEITEILGGDV